MLRDIAVLASAADLPLLAWSQRPDTLSTQISPKASAILVVSLCRKSFRVLVIQCSNILREIIAERCKDWGGELLEFDGEADHVHALLDLPPNPDLARLVNNVKTTKFAVASAGFRPAAAARVSQARVLVAVLLHYLLRWRAAVGDQTIREAAGE